MKLRTTETTKRMLESKLQRVSVAIPVPESLEFHATLGRPASGLELVHLDLHYFQLLTRPLYVE